MGYYFSKTLTTDFDTAIEMVTNALKTEGFGVLTDIDLRATFKKKLDADFPPYRILGACHPAFAYSALLAENKIGTMLPCNVIVRQTEEGLIEVAAVDPIASMQAVANPSLGEVANEVRQKLIRVVGRL